MREPDDEGLTLAPVDIDVRVQGIPCIAHVTSATAGYPARLSGPPEDCYEAEGPEVEYTILDRRGRPAPWLDRKVTDHDRQLIEEKILDSL